ncbi:MAG: TRAP transporter substrate-binding protein [Stappiaceae bacterium]
MTEKLTDKANCLPQKLSISRRKLLSTSGLGLAGVLAAPQYVTAQAPITWRMATSWPKDAPGVSSNAARLAETITAMSAGRLEIQVFTAGELVPPLQVFDAVSAGTAEMGHSAPYYSSEKDQAFHFFTGVPFGLTATEHVAWMRFGGGQELWDQAYEPFGVVPFYAGSSGPQAGGWFRSEILKIEDFKGLRIRISGLGAELMRRLGANVLPILPQDLAGALESGELDAAEWIGPWSDMALGLHHKAPFYYLPSFHEFGPALELTVNKKAYDELPKDLQKIIQAAASANAHDTLSEFTFQNIEAYKLLVEQHDVEMRTFPPEVLQILARESEKVLADIADASPLAAETYTSFTMFRSKALEYSKVSDLATLQLRETALSRPK